MKRIFIAAFLSFTLLSFSSSSKAQQTLLHYWSFNKITARVNIPAPPIKSDYSYIDTNIAVIQYDTLPGTPKAYVDSINTNKSSNGAYDNVAGDATYAQLGFPAGNALRVRNPSWSSQLRVYIPTTFYSNPVVTYELESSSTNSGQHWEVFAYSIDSGKTWRNHTTGLTVNGVSTDTLDVTQGGSTGPYQGTNWGLVTIGFGKDTNVNNNPKLVLRITFVGNASTFSGNNRLENMSVMAGPVPKSITISQPSAGSTLYRGQQQTIAYTTTGAVTPYRTIYFSSDSGVTWNQIVSTTQTLYVWSVPNANSNNCFIEIVDTNGVIGKSGRFSMRPPTITLLQPTGGGTLITGQSQLISYLTFGAVSNFRAIDYTTDSGKTWTEIVISVVDTFTWTIPYANSHTCYLEVTDQYGIVAKSGIFTILSAPPPPDTTHKTAPGGLIHYWNFTNLTTADTVPKVPRLKAFYSAIDTNAATIIDTLQPGASKYYVGWVDNVASDTTNSQLGDTSKVALRARNPTDSMEILMRIPSTGYKNLVLQYGMESSSTKSGQLVEVFDYSVDGGTTWKTSSLTVQGANVDTLDVTNPIFQGTSWGLVTVTFGNDTTVNNNPTLVLRIKFRGNTTGTSGNNRFEHVTLEGVKSSAPPPPPVPDSITVATPSTGDTLLAGTKHIISYTVTATTGAARSIDYSTNSGVTWISVATNDSALTYTWTIPATPTSKGLIRVEDSAGVIGISGTFVIVVPGTVTSVTLTTPNVTAGTSTNIMWSASGYFGNSMEIDVAYDGETWNPIITGLTPQASASYPWMVPTTLYSGVLVRVVFASGATGTSAPFNIDAPADVSAGMNSVANVKLWPNPLQTQTMIQYELAIPSNVSLSVRDILGREVDNIQEGMQSVGEHEIVFDGSHVHAGVYRYELIVDNTSSRGELVILH